MIGNGNPTLSNDAFSSQGRVSTDESMTLQGVVNKSFILIAIVMICAFYTWSNFMTAYNNGVVSSPGGLLMGLGIGGLVIALVTIFKKSWSPVTAPLYAAVEGALLGYISGMYEIRFGGIVFQAVSLTFLVFLGLLFMYKSRMIRATPKFKKIMMVGLFSIMGIYLVNMIMGFFGSSIPMIHSNGPLGIGFSLVVVGFAAFSLILDFDFIENAVANYNTPKYMEWFCGFSLLVTLIWLYLEILRLLSKLQSRND